MILFHIILYRLITRQMDPVWVFILYVFIYRFTKDSVYFKGTGGVEKKDYEVTIPLYKEIDPDKSKSFNRGR